MPPCVKGRKRDKQGAGGAQSGGLLEKTPIFMVKLFEINRALGSACSLSRIIMGHRCKKGN